MKLGKCTTHSGYARLLVGVVMAIGFLLTIWGGVAQSQNISLMLVEEHDIGFKCPRTATFNADFTRLWVLMDGCFGNNFSLQTFDTEDWSPLTPDTEDFSEPLARMNGGYIAEASAFAFTSNGTLDIRYQAGNTDENIALAIDIINGTVDTLADDFVLTQETMDALTSDATYPEFAIYNPDHTIAAVPSDTGWVIMDLNARTLLFEVPVFATASFSSDGTTLYMAEFNNPDDYSDYSATLVSYSLPDGERSENSVPVPSFIVWVSPNKAMAAVLLGEVGDALAIVDLTSGEVSPPVDIFEAPQRVLNCLNRAGDVSDFNYMSSGELYVASLNWLPDSSGFVTVNSYQGEGSGTRLCAWNFSRLREYRVETGQ